VFNETCQRRNVFTRLLRGVSKTVSAGLIACVRAYQVGIAPLLIGTCKFVPSCSQYFIQAVQTHGPIRGTRLGLWRILRCNPLSNGGIDPVPPAVADRSGSADPPA